MLLTLALHIEYKGTAYHGFQSQSGLPTVQATLENALSKIADHPIEIICAGRTDAGVHATAQIVHFKTSSKRDLRAWIIGTNTYLPKDISVKNAFLVAEDFHARYTAYQRTYRYVINNSPARSALWDDYTTYYPSKLDTYAMQQGADYLIGEFDFTSFRGADCQSKTTHREVRYCHVRSDHGFIYIDIQANAFLQHMVRNIVGTLIVVGKHLHPPEWVRSVLLSHDRKAAGQTMPANGLYLVGVNYPAPFIHLSQLVFPQI